MESKTTWQYYIEPMLLYECTPFSMNKQLEKREKTRTSGENETV